VKGFAEFRKSDATEHLGRVQCPTLITHQRIGGVGVGMEIARETAAAIPNARLLTYARSSFPTWLGDDWDSMFAPVVAFLDEGDSESLNKGPGQSGTAVILFADIVDSTALTETLGDAAFRKKARELGPALRDVIRNAGGTPIEGPTLGDGVLATFSSARVAIQAALECARAGEVRGLSLHLGLHAGDVTSERDPDGRDNVYGGAVNIAARISGLSAPGEVLVSDIVRGLARTSASVSFEDRGEQALKGVGEPVRLWTVASSETRELT
jgi:class 3 adenylate cyclase